MEISLVHTIDIAALSFGHIKEEFSFFKKSSFHLPLNHEISLKLEIQFY